METGLFGQNMSNSALGGVPLLALIIIAVVVLVPLIWSMIVITPGKRARIIERLGNPLQNARMPGLTLKFPWPIDIVVGQVNLQLQEISADVSVKTSDNAFMLLPVKAQYRASSEPEGARRAFYELEHPETQITSYILNNVRQSAAGMTMIDLYQNRDSVEAQVQESLQERFIKYGFWIENVLIDEPQPSPEVRNAFNRVIASEREKEAAQNIADAKRIELVGIALAEKESKKLQGEGIANMREAIATGMENAMKTLTLSGLNTSQALQLIMDTNRLDTLGTAASQGNLVLADLGNGAQIMSTIAAVKAADRHTQDNRQNPPLGENSLNDQNNTDYPADDYEDER